MTPDTSHERINAIGIRLGGVKRYLEIGVAKGSTFFAVEALDKHGVDPRFRFDPKSRSGITSETYHSMTSDEYFAATIGIEKPFDLIFLDGLHTFSQTLRDFVASQALSHSRTVWLIDDTVPSDAIAAEPDLNRVRSARKSEGNEQDETWMGDVYKVIAFIDSFFPQFTCITLKGRGQTVVLPIPRKNNKREFHSIKAIEKLNYVDTLLLRTSILNSFEFDFLLEKIDTISIE